jgi:phenylpyruvate tautomerase PptA (4-oxalocrotonate tautomerase family)
VCGREQSVVAVWSLRCHLAGRRRGRRNTRLGCRFPEKNITLSAELRLGCTGRSAKNEGAPVPVYTCTTNTETLNSQTKNELAAEITRIHAEINHVPTTYINVIFHEVPPQNLYADARPAGSLLINGWARQGHPEKDTTRLALEISRATCRIAEVPEDAVLVVIQSSPASAAVEGGRVLPEPGQEKAWIAQSTA